jgi:hypothetical protein
MVTMFGQFILKDDLFQKSFKNLELEVLYFDFFQKSQSYSFVNK